MASVLNPEKAKRRLKYAYIMLAAWIVISIGWLITLIVSLIDGEGFTISDGISVAVLITGYINAILVVVNTRRVARGKHPL